MGRPAASPWPPASSLGNPYHPWSSLCRMVAAIDSIGRGEMAYEGTPFRLDLE